MKINDCEWMEMIVNEWMYMIVNEWKWLTMNGNECVPSVNEFERMYVIVKCYETIEWVWISLR